MEVKVDFYSCQACVSYKGKELRLGDSSTKSEDKKNIYSLLKPVSNIRRYDILTSYMRNQNLLREERERENFLGNCTTQFWVERKKENAREGGCREVWKKLTIAKSGITILVAQDCQNWPFISCSYQYMGRVVRSS